MMRVLVDVLGALKKQSWYIALTRSRRPEDIALVNALTRDMLLRFAGLESAGPTATEQDVEEFLAMRDLFPEVVRIKRLARATQQVCTSDALRRIDPAWFAAQQPAQQQAGVPSTGNAEEARAAQ